MTQAILINLWNTGSGGGWGTGKFLRQMETVVT